MSIDFTMFYRTGATYVDLEERPRPAARFDGVTTIRCEA